MRGSEVKVLAWRVMEAEPSGAMMWFDPLTEEPVIYRLPLPVQQSVGPDGPELLAGGDSTGYLDKVVSVRAAEIEAAYREDDQITSSRLEVETGLPF